MRRRAGRLHHCAATHQASGPCRPRQRGGQPGHRFRARARGRVSDGQRRIARHPGQSLPARRRQAPGRLQGRSARAPRAVDARHLDGHHRGHGGPVSRISAPVGLRTRIGARRHRRLRLQPRLQPAQQPARRPVRRARPALFVGQPRLSANRPSPGGQRHLERRRGHGPLAERARRRGLPPADRGRVGIRRPRGQPHALSRWR